MKLFLFILCAIAACPARAALPVEASYEFALWNLKNNGQPFRIDSETLGRPGLPGADISILRAWKLQSQAPGVLVAVIDGDFDLDHPDLETAFRGNPGFDFLRGREGVSPPPADAVASHGSMVAGVIGADGTNTIGITGVAQAVKLLPIEAIPEEGEEKDTDVAAAITYAVKAGARVINCSFGKYSTSPVVTRALEFARDKGVLVVAGAGNDHQDTSSKPFWPASYSASFENVISVAASNRRDQLWPSSNFGAAIDLAAPGHEILSTGSPRGRFPYVSFSGTSAAAPHVSGVAALMIARHPAISAAELKKILLASVDPLPGLRGKVRSGGRLNAARALAQAAALAGRCDFEASKKIISRQRNGHTATWEIPFSPSLRSPYAGGKVDYDQYAQWVKLNTSWNAREILRNHIEAGEKIIRGMDPKDPFVREVKGENAHVEKIIGGEVGEIRPMNCLESIPFREFLRVVDLRKHSQELNASVLRKGNTIRIIGDFFLMPEAEGGAPGTGESPTARKLRQKLLREGWDFLAHFHNHPFGFGNPYGDIGGNAAPSEADVGMYLQEQPQEAWISNGIESLELKRTEFGKLR